MGLPAGTKAGRETETTTETETEEKKGQRTKAGTETRIQRGYLK